jgi:hypothetical protein
VPEQNFELPVLEVLLAIYIVIVSYAKFTVQSLLKAFAMYLAAAFRFAAELH